MIKRIFFLAFLFVSCSFPQQQSQLRVLKVIDGDTIKLSNGNLLRYIGIDTPEIRIKKGNEFVYSPQPFSLEAKEYNRKLVDGKIVNIEFDIDKKDRYGRSLGYCFVDGVFVNAELIRQGYAVLYTFSPNVKYADLFVKLQKEARISQRGLWSSYEVIDHTQAEIYLNQIKIVKGKVRGVYKSDKCLFLNFGKDWRRDFTVVIFNKSLNEFSKKGIDPAKFYKGKTVEVSGKILDYNGPEIIVNTPYEIEVVGEN